MNIEQLTAGQTKTLDDFTSRVQRGQVNAARKIFDANTWLSDIDSPPSMLFEWFDLPLGRTGAPTISSGLATLDFLLEKGFKMVMGKEKPSYGRVMDWFEKDPNHPHVAWFRTNGLISDKQAQQYRKRRAAKHAEEQKTRVDATKNLDASLSSGDRLDVLRGSIETWVRAINREWIEKLATPEEVAVATKEVRAASKKIMNETEDRKSQVGAMFVGYMVEHLFLNPELLSENILGTMHKCAKESMGRIGGTWAIGMPWSTNPERAGAFLGVIDDLSDSAARAWLNVAIKGIEAAKIQHGNDANTAKTTAMCQLAVAKLLKQCGPSAVNEKIVGENWTSLLDPLGLAIIENHTISGLVSAGTKTRTMAM